MAQLGEILVRHGVISRDQLIEALYTQRRMNANASLLSAAEKYLEAAELERIIDHQLHRGLTFEEAILDLDVLSKKRVSELHRERKEFRVPLGEILRRRGFLDVAELNRWIERYENERDARENPEHLAAMLRSIEIFAKLDEACRLELSQNAHWKYYEAGDLIYEEGDPGDAIYVVEYGLVRLTTHGALHDSLELGSARSGDHFGLPGALSGQDRLEHAQALVKTRCIRIMAEDLQAVLRQQPEAAVSAAELLGRDVRHYFGGIQSNDILVDTNVYTLVYDSVPDHDILNALLQELRVQLEGSVQLLHNHPDLELPYFSAEAGYAMFVPRLSTAAHFPQIVRWIHEESRHIDHLVFLIFPAQFTHTAEAAELLTLLTANSRRTLTLTNSVRPYFNNLRGERDRVQLLVGDDVERDRATYLELLHVCPESLAHISFNKKYLNETARRTVSGFLGREIALVLGGGGAKGAAHIGVLEVLEREGIAVDLGLGSSSGCVVGSLWAYGYELDELRERYVKDLGNRRVRFPDWTLPLRGSLAKGDVGRKFLLKHIGEMFTFEGRRPFLPVSVDLKQGGDVVVRGCEMWRAAFASQAIPGLLPLVEHDGMILSDGALGNNVPSSQARRFGADFVISVNISPTPAATSFNPKSVGSNMLRAVEVMMHQSTSRHQDFTDVEIRPRVFEYGMFDFEKTELFMELGRRAAEEKLPELRLLLDRRKTITQH